MKHAYLVVAHKFDYTFKTLIEMLDYPDNDIFLHMDIKCASFNEEELRNSLRFSDLYLSQRTDVHWGGYSQINAYLLLLELAVQKGHYHYYHLISGQDLPIKSQQAIQKKKKNEEREFLEISNDTKGYQYRIRYYHFVSKKLNVEENSIRAWKLGRLQKKIGLKRNKELDIKKGSNWFSITDKAARYVVDNKPWIRKHFKLSISADELFIQTLIWNSPLRDRLAIDPEHLTYSMNLREIDWVRCNGMNPHIYTIDDLDILMASTKLFARKFDCETDINIINKLKELLQ